LESEVQKWPFFRVPGEVLESADREKTGLKFLDPIAVGAADDDLITF